MNKAIQGRNICLWGWAGREGYWVAPGQSWSTVTGQTEDTAPGGKWAENHDQKWQAENTSLEGWQAKAEKPNPGVLAGLSGNPLTGGLWKLDGRLSTRDCWNLQEAKATGCLLQPTHSWQPNSTDKKKKNREDTRTGKRSPFLLRCPSSDLLLTKL